MTSHELVFIDDPTFENVREACRKPRTYVSISLEYAEVRCRVSVKGTTATIDFDLWSLGSNLSEEAQMRFREKHDPYVKTNLHRFSHSPIYKNFNPTGIHFTVLDVDAKEWFDLVLDTLLHDANFAKRPSLLDELNETQHPPDSSAGGKRLHRTSPKPRPVGPPADSPEIEGFRRELAELQRPGRPKTPETLKKVQRILKTSERPVA